MHLNQRVSSDQVWSRVGNCVRICSEPLQGGIVRANSAQPLLMRVDGLENARRVEWCALILLFRVVFTETQWLELLVSGNSERLSQKFWALGGTSGRVACVFLCLWFFYLMISAEYG